MRLQWLDIGLGVELKLAQLTERIKSVTCAVAIDAKSIYDSMHAANGPLEITEKRTAVDMLGFQQAAVREEVEVRWARGESNLADALTKPSATVVLDMCARMGFRWKLVHDPAMESAKSGEHVD